MTRPLTDAEVLSRIDQSGGPDACWPWTGPRLPKGYGLVRKTTAHRESLRIHGVDVPKGLHVCHRCDNPPCCNPRHLYVGSARDNSRDAVDRGRIAAGERHWTKRPGAQQGSKNNAAKLTEAAVIRGAELRAAGYTYGRIAAALGVSETCARRALRDGGWAHVHREVA